MALSRGRVILFCKGSCSSHGHSRGRSDDWRRRREGGIERFVMFVIVVVVGEWGRCRSRRIGFVLSVFIMVLLLFLGGSLALQFGVV